MIAGLDSSAFLPDDAGLRQAAADGIRLWAGYFDGPGIWVGWPDSNFQRIKAAGMQSLAFCSGWSDPVACRDRADRLGIHFGVDVEYGIRVDGGWVQPWLTDSVRGGLYGGSNVHPGRTAAWHIISDYPSTGDPGAVWPPYRPRPIGRVGWQWQGTVPMYGGSVDRSWLDDSFGIQTQPQGEEDMPILVKGDGASGIVWVVAGLSKLQTKSQAEMDAWAATMTDKGVHIWPQFVVDALDTLVFGGNVSQRLDALDAAVAKIKAGPQGPMGPAGPQGPAGSASTSGKISGTVTITP